MKFMPRSRLTSILLLVTTFAILGVSPSYGQSVAPDFTLTDINGRRFSLSGFRGKIVLIDFFATWCPPCREEIPHLKTLSNLYPNDTFVMISVDSSPLDTEEAVRKWVQEYEVTWTVVPPSTDSAGVANKYEIVWLPTLVFVDQESYIRGRYVGLTEAEVLRSRIEVIIPEFSTPPLVMIISLATALLLLRRRRQCAMTSNPS